MSDNVLIVAAEESSAVYANHLLQIWKKERPQLKAFGVGNQKMEANGFERIGRSEDMAVIGIVEVLKHYKSIRKVFYQLIEEARRREIKFALLIDYPDFNLRLAKELKKHGIKVVYYISPTVWAWRKKRIELIKKYVDKMLLIYPFETDFYKNHQVNYDFVGHPLIDEIDDELLQDDKIRLQKSRMGLSDSDRIIGLMPGSRRSEIKNHLQIQLDVLRTMQKTMPNLHGALLLAPSLNKEDIKPYLSGNIENFLVLQDEPFKMLQAMDSVLVASGTATLVVGLMQKPMVIMYKMNSLTAILAKLLVKVKFFGIVNLIFEKEIVPERFQSDANVNELSQLMMKTLEGKYREEQLMHLRQIPEKLGAKGVSVRVAKALNEYF